MCKVPHEKFLAALENRAVDTMQNFTAAGVAQVLRRYAKMKQVSLLRTCTRTHTLTYAHTQMLCKTWSPWELLWSSGDQARSSV